MRRQFVTYLVCVVAALFLALPAAASTWRSTSGNIFRFYPDGSMIAYWNGGEHVGYWWWISSNYKFGYTVAGSTHTVTMEGNGAICSGPGPAQYWTLMSARGAEGADEPADTKSWFLEREDTPAPKK
jgi:hypothetical protein